MKYRPLQKDEVIQLGDEIDRCGDAWRDDPVWEPVHPDNVGYKAPDPQYPSHRQYRRPVDMVLVQMVVAACKTEIESVIGEETLHALDAGSPWARVLLNF